MLNKFNIIHLDGIPDESELLDSTLSRKLINHNIRKVYDMDALAEALHDNEPSLIVASTNHAGFTYSELQKYQQCFGNSSPLLSLKKGDNGDYSVEYYSNDKLHFAINDSPDLLTPLSEAVDRIFVITNRLEESEVVLGLSANLEEAFEGIARIDPEGRFIKTNNTFKNFLGYTANELNGEYFRNIVNSADIMSFLELFNLMLHTGKAKGELRLVRKNGKEMYTKVFFSRNTDAVDLTVSCHIFIEDITKRKESEKEAEENSSFVSSVLDSLPSSIAIVDSDGKIIAVNRSWNSFALSNDGELKKCGLGANYLEVCNCAIGKNAGGAREFGDGLRRILEGEIKEFTQEYPCHSAIEERWFLAKAVRFHGGGQPKVVITHTDVTEKKRSYLLLKQSEEKFRLLVQNSTDMILVVEKGGEIKYASPSIEKVLGLLPEEQLGKNVYDFLHPDDVARIRQEFAENAGVPGNLLKVEHWTQKSDGTYIYVESVLNNLLHDPLVKGIVINSRDVTDRKFADEMKDAALNEKGVLLKEINHRVKNNLQVVTSLLKLQEKSISDENLKRVFLDSINRMNTMSLLHKKLYQGGNFSHVDFGNYIKGIVDFLSETYDTRKKNITCIVEAEEMELNLETSVPCGLIVNELVSNSFKYAFPGGTGGKVHVKLEGGTKNMLTISDNGCGLPDDVNLHDSKTMGLALVHTLAQQMGAIIEVDSTNGACFRIKFGKLDYRNRLFEKN
jgi:PAS domain S-box-containing protein